jgi:hypothetical protein
MISILLTVTVRSQQKTTDFSGRWKLNREMSDFGTGPDGGKRSPRSHTMLIEQDEKNLKVEFVHSGRDGNEKKTRFKYSLEGKTTKNKLDIGRQKSTARWIDNDQILEIDSEVDVKRGDMEFTMETVQFFSIVDDRLVIESVRYTPRGDMKMLAIYDRLPEGE